MDARERKDSQKITENIFYKPMLKRSSLIILKEIDRELRTVNIDLVVVFGGS